MSEDKEPLEQLPVERWSELQEIFKVDWPRGISGYAALEMQKHWAEQEIDYELKVYCPFGELSNGMVGVNSTVFCNEILIQCPNDCTDQLRDALVRTRIIDWNREEFTVPNAPHNVIECLRKTAQDLVINMQTYPFLYTFLLEQEFENISLPSNITFEPVTLDHLDLVNSTWCHRYQDSTDLFEILIKNKCSSGFYIDNELISWVFMREFGPLIHLYTVEDHRRKGYGALLLKLVSNKLLKEKKPVFTFCFKNNVNACNLFKKLGFLEGEEVAWCCLNKKSK